MQTTKQNISMRQAIEKYFVVNHSANGRDTFTCRLCGVVLRTVTGVSKHWRITHQHDTRIYID